MKKKEENGQQKKEARMPDYSDFRRTSARGQVHLGVWVNGSDNGLRFRAKLEYEYLGDDGWRKLNHPMCDQWLAAAKMLSDVDTWKHRYLREKREAERNEQKQKQK